MCGTFVRHVRQIVAYRQHASYYYVIWKIFFNALFGSPNHFGQNVLHLVPKNKKKREKKRRRKLYK